MENLEWVTVSENTKHAYDNNLAKSNGGLNQKVVYKIDPFTDEVIKRYSSITEASIDNKTTNRYSISKAARYGHKYLGFKWKFGI